MTGANTLAALIEMERMAFACRGNSAVFSSCSLTAETRGHQWSRVRFLFGEPASWQLSSVSQSVVRSVSQLSVICRLRLAGKMLLAGEGEIAVPCVPPRHRSCIRFIHAKGALMGALGLKRKHSWLILWLIGWSLPPLGVWCPRPYYSRFER